MTVPGYGGGPVKMLHTIELEPTAAGTTSPVTYAANAGATEVRQELSDLEGVLTLEVSDNGVGASPQAFEAATAYGVLHAMKAVAPQTSPSAAID